MREHYYCGAAKACGTGQIVMVKTEEGYLDAGDIVEVYGGGDRHLAEVICTSLVGKGSKDEAVMTAHSPVYEIEKIYRKYWEKKEEENEND